MSSSTNDPKLQDQKGFNESCPTTDDDHIHHSFDNNHEPYLKPKTPDDHDASSLRSRSSARETNTRLADDLAVMEAERVVSQSTHDGQSKKSRDHHSIRSRRSAVDEFDEATNPLHERAALYQPPEKPTTKVARFVKTLHESSFVVRYLTYILPLVVILLIPLLVGALAFPEANVGGVSLLWFSVWLEILWLTAWAGRVCVIILFRITLEKYKACELISYPSLLGCREVHSVPRGHICQYLHQQREKMARRSQAVGAPRDLLFLVSSCRDFLPPHDEESPCGRQQGDARLGKHGQQDYHFHLCVDDSESHRKVPCPTDRYELPFAHLF